MKIKKPITIMLFVVVLFVLFSLAGYAQGLAGCCCDFTEGLAQSDSFLEYTDCLPENHFVMPRQIDSIMNRTCDEICALRSEEFEDDEEPGPGPSKRCGDVGFKPGPTSPRATNIKGEKQIRITWAAECPVDFFKILRCRGTDCDNFELITDQVASTYFVDDAPSLLWDEDYKYRIIAHYNLQGDSDPADVIVNTGDIECWKRFSAENFCLSTIYYNDFADYFKSHGYGFTPPGDFITNYTGSVKDQFFDKFNKAFVCGDDNKLGGANDICATKGIVGICIVDEGIPDCIVPTECESIGGGTFGLYYDRTECEGTALDKQFCYLDKSKSIVDKCYSCAMDMSCYDYRSQGACEKDNCGVGECTWKDIYSDIGVGVCVDERFSNCYLCDAEPTGPSSESYNEVFEQCSKEKSDALATLEHPCYWKGWQSLSCDEVTCRTYKRPSECASPSGGIQLYPNNTVMVRSSDPCEVGVCQWRPNPLDPDQGDCLKNADGDSGLWPDCSDADDEDACELDYIPPDTTIVASGALGVYDKLNINIFDKISRTDPGEYKTGSRALGYTTYFCHYPEGQAECDVHIDPLSTRVSSLALSYLTLHNTEVMESQDMLTELAVGFNFIKYYSIDASKNPGPIKTVRVYACARCVGPQIIYSSLKNAITIGGRHYTNALRPVLEAVFDVDAEITTAEINTPQGTFIADLTYSSENGKNYTFITESALDEGEYMFRINAKDDEGTYMNEEFTRNFVVDLTAGTVNFTVDGKPAEGRTINKSQANLEITLEERVSDIQIFMNGREITGAFSQQENRIFTGQNVVLDEGTVILSIIATDFAGNSIDDANTKFFVNGRPPVIRLRYPSFGVSPNFKFNITVETLNSVNCRYLYDVPIPADYSYEDLERFDSTDSNMHVVNEFTRIPDGDYNIHTLHVFCIDPLWDRANASFKVSVDTTDPLIKTAYADPEVIKEEIAENTYRTYLKVSTTEPTLCRYSDTKQTYRQMEEEFPGYVITPHIPWPNNREIPKISHIKEINVTDPTVVYDYYVACEDLAGRVSETKLIDFDIDLSIGFDVFDRTAEYTNESSIMLAVETNKRAFCFYGRDNNSLTNSFQNDGEYAHTTDLVNLPEGENKFYVRCQTRYLAQEVSKILPVSFTVDTSPPEMVYVDDSSNLISEPDVSYLPSSLRASWLAEDNQTNVTRYHYRIETFYGQTEIRNWTISTISNDWVMVNGLNLTEQITYKFLVKPENAAGLLGEIMGSDGVLFDPTKRPASCNNSGLDVNESDVDCGGICPPCTEGKLCKINTDCLSMYCKDGTCAAAACDDLAHNGDESDVDCGGSCQPCALGGLCIDNSDCESGNCQSGMCAEPDACINGVLDGIETDVDCGGACPRCDTGKSCNVHADCYSNLCVDNVCIPKKSEGESCLNNTECQEGLICKEEICQIKKAAEGEFCASDAQCEDGSVCYQSRCALDSDGDGMPDEWEVLYGLDPNNPGDALIDSDEDGLSNADEFGRGTNPSVPDTDNDKWSDGQEIRFGTDPLDNNSKPSAFMGLFYNPASYWWLWLLIVLIIAGLAVGGYYGYNAYKEFQKAKEKERKEAKAVPKKAEKPSRVKEITPEERKRLAAEAEKEREIEDRLAKVREIIEKKIFPGKETKPKSWVDIRNVLFPLRKKRPEELKPIFRKLEQLKKGKLGERGRKEALDELERLLGKKEKKKLEEERKKEGIIEKKKTKGDIFARLKKIIEQTEKEKEEELKALERMPFGKLKMMALKALSPEERKSLLEKFMLLKTGKLTVDERRELFEKLREIAEYSKKLEPKKVKEKAVKKKEKPKKKKTLKKKVKKKKTRKKKRKK